MIGFLSLVDWNDPETAAVYQLSAWLAVIGGATMNLTFVWLVADTLNAMMAIPNLIALVILSPIVFSITREFFDTRGKSEDNPF